jgi:hypothetical protein
MRKIKDRSKQIKIAKRKYRRELKRRVFKHCYKPLIAENQNYSKNISYTSIEAPREFSILSSRADVIKYFNRIKCMIDHKEYTQMNLSKIEKIDLPTLCFLGAFMLDRNTNSHYLKVRGPRKHTVAYNFFKKAQFEEMILDKKRANFSNGTFLFKRERDVNNKAIGEILDKTIDYFGENNKSKLRDLSAIIIEIITNTADHADPSGKNSLPWIVNTYETNDTYGNRLKQYCLIDMGVGIYETLTEKAGKKDNNSSWKNIFRGEPSQGKFFSKAIPKGIQSRTSLPERGKGIKYIYETVKDNSIYRNFDIITNKAKISLTNINSVEEDSGESLPATIYYWEICIE